MRRLLCFLVVILTIQSLGVLALSDLNDEEATEEVTLYSNEDVVPGSEEEIVSYSPEEDDYTGDEEVYLNNYDDIQNAFGAVDQDALYQEAFQEQLDYEKELYQNNIRYETIKAKVISGDKELTYYSMDNYYQIYRIKYQPITVELLEGEFKGEQFDTNYVLSVDDYDNIKVKKLSVNQTINVVVSGDKIENLEVYATTLDSGIARFHLVVILVLIMLVCIAIFLGTTGLKVVPMLILVTDLLLFVFIPEMCAGRGIWWLTVVSMLAYIIVENAIKLGISLKALASAIATIAVVVIITLAFYGFNELAGISGITVELANIAQAYPMKIINFYNLNMATFAWIAFVIVSNISCQTVRVYAENEEEEAKKKIRKYVSGMLPLVVIMTIALTLQKCVYLHISRYTLEEFTNSEMILNELLRGIFLIIAMTVTTQVAAMMKKVLVIDEVEEIEQNKDEEKETKKTENKKEEEVESPEEDKAEEETEENGSPEEDKAEEETEENESSEEEKDEEKDEKKDKKTTEKKDEKATEGKDSGKKSKNVEEK